MKEYDADLIDRLHKAANRLSKERPIIAEICLEAAQRLVAIIRAQELDPK